MTGVRRIWWLSGAHVALAGGLAAVFALAPPGADSFALHLIFHLGLFAVLAAVLLPVLRRRENASGAPAGGSGRRGLALVLLAGLLSRGFLIVAPPALSGDVFRLIWEGRVVASGADPWALPPDAPELAQLRAEHPEIAAGVAYELLPAIYPPGMQLFTAAVTAVSDRVAVMKAALALMEGVLVAALLALLVRRRLDPMLAAGWVWNPLVLAEVAGSGHGDVLGVALAALALVAASRGRGALAAALAGVSGAVKFAGFALVALFLCVSARAGRGVWRSVAEAAPELARRRSSPCRFSSRFFFPRCPTRAFGGPEEAPGSGSRIGRARSASASCTTSATGASTRVSSSLSKRCSATPRARSRSPRWLASGPVCFCWRACALRRSRRRWRSAPSRSARSCSRPPRTPWYLLWSLPFLLLHPERPALLGAVLALSATTTLSYYPMWTTPPGAPWVLPEGLRAAEYLLPAACAALLAWRSRRRLTPPGVPVAAGSGGGGRA